MKLRKYKAEKLQAHLVHRERYVLRGAKVIDLVAIEAMASIGCTCVEMAMASDMSEHTFSQMKNAHSEVELAIARGSVSMKQSLRRKQVDLAMSGSASMLIWLGKQYLGQSDKSSIENKTEVNITVQRAMEELRSMPKGLLLEAQALLDTGISDAVAEEVAQPQS